jgi:group I intron endonuclease
LEGKAGIYLIANNVNGNAYVGSSYYLFRRRNQHFNRLLSNNHVNQLLQDDFNIHGFENFKWAVLEVVNDPDGRKLSTKENYYIKLLGSNTNGYNRLFAVPLDRHVFKTKERRSWNKGRPHSAETKVKIGTANRGRSVGLVKGPLPESVKEKIRVKAIGRKHSPEVIERIRLRKIGVPLPSRGRKNTPEQIANIKRGQAAYLKRYWTDGEFRRQRMESNPRRGQPFIAKRKPVVQLSLNGEVIAFYSHMSEASAQSGVQLSGISNCVNGKKTTAGGFIWRHANEIRTR